MIRVNLLRNKVGEQTAVTSIASAPRDTSEMRDALIKFALVSLFTVALMLYEASNIRALNENQVRLSGEVAELQQVLTAKAAEVELIKDVEVQAKELEDKLKILKFLSRLRLREVKTLDFMQSSIPEKVWLRSVQFEANREQLDLGHYKFEGGAVATEDLTEFVKRLENSAYLADVIVLKNLEVALGQSKTLLRDFQFSAEVEKQN